MSSRRPAALAAAAALLLGGCAGPQAEDDRVLVLASIYPLQYVAEQVGGDHVRVEPLTPPGAEPHDLELSPRQVRAVGEADVVVLLGGFQAAVDEAVEARDPEHVVDAADVPQIAAHAAQHDEDDHGEDHGDDGHAHDGADPHFWLDPTLLAAVAGDVAQALADADPEHAADYEDAAAALEADLLDLDAELAEGLASCERDVIVTSHAAFGYLAERYGLEQVGISGLDPEAEPSPARLREVRELAQEHDVTTVFTETLVSPDVAEALAGDLGVQTAVLDPIESQADQDTDYRGAMERNLQVLREALACA
ncbi:metal ABC transporter substrate-binding protein [Actinotalea sp. JY-7885]|uniref:metal ABC transporter substrate-binding protein n=1 Tax=Actinotalea sp. JY-7885 TaxID=2758576 RepID=UPI001CB6E4B4|nr:metal ABC transporter substrate-binding protein [Actinotalea sp. JY-7885]